MKKCRECGWMEGGSGEVKPERLDGGCRSKMVHGVID